MKTLEAQTWEEAKELLRSIDDERKALIKKHGFHKSSEFLFRGHANASWPITTTLDRVTKEPLPLSEYFRHVLKTRPQVEAFGSSRWELPELEEYTKWAESISDLNWPEYPGYEYMIFLRHHGFPSPLLDWSESPYVAAFFAFRHTLRADDSVALFCYLERLGNGKSWSGGDPLITVKGPYARSHRRHFLQQCKYSLCAKLRNKVLCYEPHESVFALNNPTQDLLWKIEMPASVGPVALKDLDYMNINALSLIGTDDALIETLATREYRIHGA